MTRVKMLVALPKRADVSNQFFHDHWRHPHGTWGRTISTIQHYVQSHRIDTPHLGVDQSRYEGVVELWFAGVDDAVGVADHPTYRKYLVPDEPNFIDMAGVKFAFTDEEILMAGPAPVEEEGSADHAWREDTRPTAIKLIQLVEAHGSANWWGADEVSLGRAIGALRHVRLHLNATVHPAGSTREGGLIGARELWWPTLSAFEEGIAAAPDACKSLISRPEKSVSALFLAERMI